MFDMLSGQYKNLASKGRYGDTMLAHITPEEAALLKARGGAGTINPQTGLREFYGFNQFQFLPQIEPEPLPSLGQILNPDYVKDIPTKLNEITIPAVFRGGLGGATPAVTKVSDEYSQYADLSPAGGMGSGNQIEGYTVPTDKEIQGQKLSAIYDTKGNFQYLTMAGDQFLTPDTSQPYIIAKPKINEKGELIDAGVFDVRQQDDGGFGGFVGGLLEDFGPMILAGIGANLLAPAAGAAGAAAGGGAAALSPYAAQAAGAYGGSAAAAAAAAAGSLPGIQAASAAQNALTQAARNNTGITFGQGVTPTSPPTPSTPTPEPTPAPAPTPPAPSGSGSPMPGVTPPPVVPPTVTPPPVIPPIPTSSIFSGGVPGLIDAAIKNPSITGAVLGAVTSAIGSANAPTSQTSTTSIDPQIKAEYLANLERAKATAAGLEARQIAQPGQLYTDAESKLYNLGMTPFGEADIARFFNPYQEQVVTGALGDIERTRLMQEQANRDQATRARAFGGSRQGVVTGMTNEAALRQAANTAAQLRSAGYTQAANLGLQARPMDIAGLQTSLGLGTTRTALEQARLDALRNLGTERLGITSGALGLQPANVGQTSSQPLYNNTAGNLLSGGLTGAYIGSLLGK